MGAGIARLVAVAGTLATAPAAFAQPSPDAAPAPVPVPDVVAPDAAPAPEPDAAPVPDVAVEPVPEPEPEPEPDPVGSAAPTIQIHGFVSEGGFVSSANEYIGHSTRGSLELFEAGLNVSSDVADRLRAGVQLFARDFGTFDDAAPRIDWAFLDYRWRSWLGLRAGIIKMPFGLYNEYTDIDAGRVPILMPQSVYPFRNRDVLLSHRGFAVYGTADLGGGGELDYQAWLGTLSIPRNALTLTGAELDSVDTRYVTGAQVFWSPPVEGLRIGGTFLRASIDFHLTLSEANTAFLIMNGLVPPDFDGRLVVSQKPDTLIIGSAEYQRGDWLFAAEYARTLKHQQTSLPMIIPPFDEDEERFYGMVTRQLLPSLTVGAYYSVVHLDVDDRRGHDMHWGKPYYAFQRDAAATVRYDVNDHWLWKAEAHLVDGTADLDQESNPQPDDRYWALFLVRTTVTF